VITNLKTKVRYTYSQGCSFKRNVLLAHPVWTTKSKNIWFGKTNNLW